MNFYLTLNQPLANVDFLRKTNSSSINTTWKKNLRYSVLAITQFLHLKTTGRCLILPKFFLKSFNPFQKNRFC
jgi:hypothetical protein